MNQLKTIMPALMVASLVSAGLYVFAVAPRKVTIPASYNGGGTNSSGIDLLNGSSSTVFYKITCYDKSGNQKFLRTNLSLAPKAAVNHAGVPKCSDGSVMMYSTNFSNGGGVCSPYRNYTDFVASPNSACPSGYTACTWSNYASARVGTAYYSGWVDNTGFVPSSAANTWSYSWDNGTTWSANVVDQIPSANPGNSAARCASGLAGAGTVQSYCSVQSAVMTSPTVCCPGPSAEQVSDSCVVEIDPSTPQDGYLQSPQFKGSAAF